MVTHALIAISGWTHVTTSLVYTSWCLHDSAGCIEDLCAAEGCSSFTTPSALSLFAHPGCLVSEIMCGYTHTHTHAIGMCISRWKWLLMPYTRPSLGDGIHHGVWFTLGCIGYLMSICHYLFGSHASCWMLVSVVLVGYVHDSIIL